MARRLVKHEPRLCGTLVLNAKYEREANYLTIQLPEPIPRNYMAVQRARVARAIAGLDLSNITPRRKTHYRE